MPLPQPAMAINVYGPDDVRCGIVLAAARQGGGPAHFSFPRAICVAGKQRMSGWRQTFPGCRAGAQVRAGPTRCRYLYWWR